MKNAQGEWYSCHGALHRRTNLRIYSSRILTRLFTLSLFFGILFFQNAFGENASTNPQIQSDVLRDKQLVRLISCDFVLIKPLVKKVEFINYNLPKPHAAESEESCDSFEVVNWVVEPLGVHPKRGQSLKINVPRVDGTVFSPFVFSQPDDLYLAAVDCSADPYPAVGLWTIDGDTDNVSKSEMEAIKYLREITKAPRQPQFPDILRFARNSHSVVLLYSMPYFVDSTTTAEDRWSISQVLIDFGVSKDTPKYIYRAAIEALNSIVISDHALQKKRLEYTLSECVRHLHDHLSSNNFDEEYILRIMRLMTQNNSPLSKEVNAELLNRLDAILDKVGNNKKLRQDHVIRTLIKTARSFFLPDYKK